MSKLFARSCELLVRRRWLKTIDRECEKYNKLKSKLNQQRYIINGLVKKYNEIYGEDLRTPQKEERDE